MKARSALFVLLTSAVFGAGLWTGWHFRRPSLDLFAVNKELAFQTRLGQKPGSLINPLVACDTATQKNFEELNPLRDDLAALIKTSLQNQSASRISVYYRDLNSGRWTGVNQDDKYIPASLVKVPLLMTYYKMADSDPKILDKKLLFQSDQDENLNQVLAKPPTPLTQGKEYSVEELISRMIAYSGNNSHLLLANQLDPNYRKKIYEDLGVQYSQDFESPTVDSVSPRSFATFFRVLYNSTYLGEEMSEKALQLLTQTTFTDGLAAGVPKDTTVAHKFGERTIFYNSTGEVVLRELHDCGIIYYPDRPYALCVMTQGQNFDKLKGIISDISRQAYQFSDHPTVISQHQ